jgi:hypothetical protein
MVSSHLSTLREQAKKQAALYKAYRTKAVPVIQDKNIDVEWRWQMLQKHINDAQAELATLKEQRVAARAAIVAASEKRKFQATPESRAKVQQALQNGFPYHQLVTQLVSEGDRSALQALREYLPYAAHGGYLPPTTGGGKGSVQDQQVKSALETLNRSEQALWDDGEKRAAAELVEVEQSINLMDHNDATIEKYLGGQLLSQADRATVDRIFHWQDLGNPDSLGVMTLHNEVSTPTQAGTPQQAAIRGSLMGRGY